MMLSRLFAVGANKGRTRRICGRHGSAFRRLDPATEAGRFGNEGRNAVRGPGLSNVDVSALKSLTVTETIRVQFRAECFNIANHANFAIPDNDIASPTSAGRCRRRVRGYFN